MRKQNLNEILIETLINGGRRRVLLHCCCAPCAGYVVDLLHGICDLKLLYYNPNITDAKEYELRLAELIKLGEVYDVEVIDGGYDVDAFNEAVKGLENEPEGGSRCGKCIGERLKQTAIKADELNCDYFLTTLTVSPHKNAELINALGQAYDKYFASNFKKNNGYKKSVEICVKHGFYRQNYCGCEFSKRDN